MPQGNNIRENPYNPRSRRTLLVKRTLFKTNTDWTDSTLSLQKNATQSHKLQNNQGKSMIAEDSFVPLL